MDYSAIAGGKEKETQNFITSALTAESKRYLILGLLHPNECTYQETEHKNGFSYSDKVQETDIWEDRLTKKVLKPGSPSLKGNQFPVAILGKTRHSHLGHHHGFL